jgi:hypothetical protein
MVLNQIQKDYVKNVISQNRGSQTPIMKDHILKFATDLGLQLPKSTTKESVLNLIFNIGNEDKFFDEFAHYIDVPFWDAAKLNNISYKQLSDLDQLGVISALTYTGHKDATLYPLSVLSFKEGELLEIWNNKNKTDFFRTRIEVENIDDVQNIINELSQLFEVENISKPYPHRENLKGCYIYLSIRSLNGSITNYNYKNEENAKLKLENSTLKGEIEDLKSKIASLNIDSRNTPAYKNLEKQINELNLWRIEHMSDSYEIESLKKKITELEANTTTTNGGRPQKFTDQEKETMKMYRLQGKSIRKIAEIFNCSTGLVHKIVSQQK